MQTTAGFTSGNHVDGASTFEAEGATSLAADFVIEDFGNASLRGGTHVAGNLVCNAGGDAYCDDRAAVVAGSSSCARCPKP